jgi:hypothetical protein
MENEIMMKKLPDGICTRWAKTIVESEENKNRYPTFDEFTKFLHREADIAHKMPDKKELESLTHPNKEAFRNAKSFAIAAGKPASQPMGPKRTCAYCTKDNHTTSDCFQLGKRSILRGRGSFSSKVFVLAALNQIILVSSVQNRSTAKFAVVQNTLLFSMSMRLLNMMITKPIRNA